MRHQAAETRRFRPICASWRRQGGIASAWRAATDPDRRAFAAFARTLHRLTGGAGATAVADVRSAPVSRFSPHFNKAAFAAALAARGIDYIFLGRELGGRPEQKAMYTQGVADYEKMAVTPDFHAGIARMAEAAEQSRVAAMCSEADPLDCHRCLLVARALVGAGVEIAHILASGEVARHAAVRISCCNSPASLSEFAALLAR